MPRSGLRQRSSASQPVTSSRLDRQRLVVDLEAAVRQRLAQTRSSVSRAYGAGIHRRSKKR